MDGEITEWTTVDGERKRRLLNPDSSRQKIDVAFPPFSAKRSVSPGPSLQKSLARLFRQVIFGRRTHHTQIRAIQSKKAA